MLHSVEMNPNFCTHLRESFAGVNVHHMSACDLDKLGLNNVQAVISGLPLLSMPIGVQRDILNGSFNSLAPEGSFVQFTYGPNPSVNADLRKEMALSWTCSDKIWRNLPPARVYRFTRPMH
jgi:phosphatidylethanolamine/phosphatidyl-N-methylethanolamine N-methyltransferase